MWKVPHFLVAELAPLMAKRGNGAIVNISTMVADYGVSGTSLYGSSKAAINLLTKAWTAEYGPGGVRINAVSPGPTRTEGTRFNGRGSRAISCSGISAGRPATADEIAEAIVFLATYRPFQFYLWRKNCRRRRPHRHLKYRSDSTAGVSEVQIVAMPLLVTSASGANGKWIWRTARL